MITRLLQYAIYLTLSVNKNTDDSMSNFSIENLDVLQGKGDFI